MLPGSKSVIRTLLLILVLAAAFLFFYPMKNGKPLLSLDKLRTQNLPDISLPDVKLPTLRGDSASGQVTVYKWKDASGNWQFSNEPPPDGTPYQTTAVDPNANLIQGMDATTPRDGKSGVNRGQGSNSSDRDEALETMSDAIQPTRKAKDALKQHEEVEQKLTE